MKPPLYALVMALVATLLVPGAAAHAFDVQGSAFLGLKEFPASLSATRDPQDPDLFIFVVVIGDPFEPDVFAIFLGTSNYQGEHGPNNNFVTVPMTASSANPSHDFEVAGVQTGDEVRLVGNYNNYTLVLGFDDL